MILFSNDLFRAALYRLMLILKRCAVLLLSGNAVTLLKALVLHPSLNELCIFQPKIPGSAFLISFVDNF